MAEEKIKNVSKKYVTEKRELQGFISLLQPSQRFRTYSTNVLLTKEEGEALCEEMKKMRHEQYVLNGKKGQLADLPCTPFGKQNEDTGEFIPDPEGRYVLKTKIAEKTQSGKMNPKPMIVNAKGQPITGTLKIGEGTIAKVHVTLSGYATGGKVGITAKLLGVQIFELVEYETSSSISLSDFDVEETGFDGVGEATTEETATQEAPVDENDPNYNF